MTSITVFVWEGKDWGVRMGYTYSWKKAKRIKKVLEEKAEWFKEFRVEGWSLSLFGIKSIKEKRLMSSEYI